MDVVATVVSGAAVALAGSSAVSACAVASATASSCETVFSHTGLLQSWTNYYFANMTSDKIQTQTG